MTTTETPASYVEPVRTPAPGRALASAVAVFLGGYILVQSLSSNLATYLAVQAAREPEAAVLLLTQLVFALAVVVVGFFLAPAPVGRKFLASALVVVGSILVVVTQAMRVSGAIRWGAGGVPLTMTLINAFFMVALTVGAGWLIVRSARVGWLALLATVILIPLPYLFTVANISWAIIQIVMLILLGIVGVVILLAGRPARG